MLCDVDVIDDDDDAETCCEFEEEIIEDELLSDTDKASFESMMNEISQKPVEEKPSCQSCSGGPIPHLKIPKTPPPGVPSIAGMPGLPNIDPQMFANVLFNVMNILEDKVREAMNITELGTCPLIKPIDIFLMQNPYVNYEEIISKNDGLETLNKMNELRSEVKLKISGV